MRALRVIGIGAFGLALPIFSSAASSLASAIDKLSDSNPKERAEGARIIKETLKAHPEAAGDPGEAYWKGKFSGVKPGMSLAEIQKITGATAKSEGGACSGMSCTVMIRLDDYWLATLFMSEETKTQGLMSVSGFSRHARSVYLDPPKNFSGKWLTYFINGEIAFEIDFRSGQRTRFQSFQDNGRLLYEQGDAIFKGEKPEIGHYPDGSKMYEGNYKAGKMDGVWTHWYKSGKKQSEISYINGEMNGIANWHENGQKSLEVKYDGHGHETGQAAWKEDGSLQYAHGSLAVVYEKK